MFIEAASKHLNVNITGPRSAPNFETVYDFNNMASAWYQTALS